MKTILHNARGMAMRFAVLLSATTGALLSIPLGAMIASAMVWAQDTKREITIDNFTFSTPTLTVPVGTTVTWVNHDDIPHSVVAKNKEFRSKALDTDDSYSFTFASAGTFDYFCGLHPHMQGKIIVR